MYIFYNGHWQYDSFRYHYTNVGDNDMNLDPYHDPEIVKNNNIEIVN